MGLWTLRCIGAARSARVWIVVLSWSFAATTFAQAPAAGDANDVVSKLNVDALEAFNALEINKAGAMLEEALRIASQGGVSADLVARTNLNMGTVLVSGLADADGAVPFYIAAICTDPNIQLDPLTSTPEVQSAFAVAQQRAQSGECAQGAAPPTGVGVAAPIAPVRPPPEQAIIHHPPLEQLAQTPLPIYAEVHALAGAKQIVLFYRGTGMEQWRQVPMYRYQGGFAYQISCNDIWEPKVAYYIEAQGEGGLVVGIAGTAAQPIEVPIVSARTQAEPALPQAASPRSCAASECPPGLKGCERAGTAAIGEACESTADCQSGLGCTDDDVCMLLGGGGTEVPEYDAETGSFEDIDDPVSKEPKRWFVQLGFATGLSYMMQGMEADRPAPRDRVFIGAGPAGTTFVANPEQVVGAAQTVKFPEPGAPGEEAFLTAWVPDSDSSDTIGVLDSGCAGDGVATGPAQYLLSQRLEDLYPSSYCVRVKSTGFVPQVALRTAIGYFISSRFAASALFRLQLGSGRGTLAGILLGARAEYLLTEPRATGLSVSGFGGLTFGQIQVQPSAQGSTDGAPFAMSGPLGAHVGSTVRYRFIPNLGVYGAPEIDVQLPALLFHVDATIGLEAAF